MTIDRKAAWRRRGRGYSLISKERQGKGRSGKTRTRVSASYPAGPDRRLLESHQRCIEASPQYAKWLDRLTGAAAVHAVIASRNTNKSGRQNMVTKQEDALIVKNLIALAAVEVLGGAIALGLTFHLF